MKTLKLISFAVLILILAQSCRKDSAIPQTQSPASFTLVNTVVSSPAIVTNFSNNPVQWYSNSQKTFYGGTFELAVPGGSVPISLSFLTDTLHTVYHQTQQLKSGGIYTLFLMGDVSKPDTLFKQDNPPYHSIADSTIGVRFVNLSTGSSPVSVNIQGLANGSEVSSLPYKAVTGFKNYNDATGVGSNYVFEFRDAASGNLLGTYTLSDIDNGIGNNSSTNSYRFKNFTIAVYGKSGGSSLSTLLIKNN